MSETQTYGVILLVGALIMLISYALTILKNIQAESAVIRDQASQIRTQGEVNREAIGNNREAIGELDFSVKPNIISEGITASGDALNRAVAGTMKDLKFSEDIGTIRKSADNVEASVATIQEIFMGKQSAAGWSEMELERSLKDSFRNVMIRKKVAKLDTIPDAHLVLSDGRILCIDSKFPVSSFKAVLKGDAGSQKSFVSAIKGHIDKVEKSYIQPNQGTSEIAYLYIASEGIYNYMASEESDLLRDAADRRVVICSPATLVANMHLIRISEQAMGIAGKTDEIIKGHSNLRKKIGELQDIWGKLSSQISNSYSNRSKLQSSIESLEQALSSVENLDLRGDED